MKSQYLTNELTNESSTLNGLSLGGYWGRDLCEHVVRHMKKKNCFICLTVFTLTLYIYRCVSKNSTPVNVIGINGQVFVNWR